MKLDSIFSATALVACMHGVGMAQESPKESPLEPSQYALLATKERVGGIVLNVPTNTKALQYSSNFGNYQFGKVSAGNLYYPDNRSFQELNQLEKDMNSKYGGEYLAFQADPRGIIKPALRIGPGSVSLSIDPKNGGKYHIRYKLNF